MEEALFKFLQSHILGSDGIQHFDWYNGQPDDPKAHDTFKKPAVFVRILPYQVKTLSTGRQTAQVDFELIVCQDIVKPFNKIAGEQAQNKQFKSLGLAPKITKRILLKSDKNNGIGTILRKTGIPDHAFEAIINQTEVYSCRIVDDSARIAKVSFPNDADKTLTIQVDA